MNIKKPTILIVDDMAINIQILSNILKDEYQIKIATTGEKAIEIVSADNSIDLILLDIDMPVMDGYQVCNILKSQYNTRDIPIVFVTAIMGSESEEVGLHLGATDYIVKPFSYEIVRLRVRNQINLKLKNDLLAKFVMIDGLTHIPDRRAFDEKIGKSVSDYANNHQLLAVALFNLDYFSDYNDNYGHGNGDICLQKIANFLSSRHLENAEMFVARHNGGEFGVIIKGNISTNQVRSELENIVKEVQAMGITHKFSDEYEVITVSAGAVILGSEHKHALLSLEDVLSDVNKMLANAREHGRNQLCVTEY